jgi:hypothetical protein
VQTPLWIFSLWTVIVVIVIVISLSCSSVFFSMCILTFPFLLFVVSVDLTCNFVCLDPANNVAQIVVRFKLVVQLSDENLKLRRTGCDRFQPTALRMTCSLQTAK